MSTQLVAIMCVIGLALGALGLAVTQNSGWQARLSNAFAASGAAQNHVDLSYESPEWKALNKNLANDYLQRYKDNDFTSPSWNEIQKFHNDRYQRANIHPDS